MRWGIVMPRCKACRSPDNLHGRVCRECRRAQRRAAGRYLRLPVGPECGMCSNPLREPTSSGLCVFCLVDLGACTDPTIQGVPA